jgi:hypothetical protein
LNLGYLTGTPERIQTSDLLLRRRAMQPHGTD